MTTKEFSTLLQNKLTSEYGVDLSVASNQQIYRALALICRQMMSDNYKKFQSKVIGTGSKQVYYLCKIGRASCGERGGGRVGAGGFRKGGYRARQRRIG